MKSRSAKVVVSLKETTLKSYQIELSDEVASLVEYQATLHGGSPEQLIRSIVWEHYRPAFPIPPKPTLEQQMVMYAPIIQKFLSGIQASSGQLSCINCTQRLTPADVHNGFCSKCREPIQGL